MNNKGVDQLLEIEREKGASLKIDDILEQVAGVYPKVMIDGDMDAGAWSCGMVVGLIHDIPTVKELIDRIMADAERIIRQRLTGFLDGADAKARLPPGRSPSRMFVSDPMIGHGPVVQVRGLTWSW